MTDVDSALDLLEELLSITEGVKDILPQQDRDAWLEISAKCADLRDGEAT